ncbi:ABC transporter ATP-binding protein [Thermodesulfovibrio thiophilus]|uniref:ABC transporter ATP-binding protein n=1 Tax=Thermodesulfovibrio thiophilus TaxID=340095 RepID=UPI00178E32E3|nr:oligopeptide/dipeptide ABC transporter ATP-binding protein [Thermodesulfovibrio thiophilus]HHW20996.1 ATP-binding cassette domain-containing protein [Thermodesulfovibrio thiophilus]
MSVIETQELSKTFKIKNLTIPAVDNLNLKIDTSDFLALVGESGSGKSTVARLLLKLLKPDAGRILFKNIDIWQIEKENLKKFRQSVQIIFQDPYASLNPRMRIYSILEEPLKIHTDLSLNETKSQITQIMQKMGLTEEFLYRYPHQLSGGQRQRVAIARALILQPQLLIADEPLSSLDISLQAGIINSLTEMKHTKQFGILFITHDLNIVRAISNKVAVMHLGRIVEESSTNDLFYEPLHPYTRVLLNSIPGFHRRNRKKEPKLSTEEILWNFTGCRFYSRCKYKMSICKSTPSLKELNGRKVRCFLFQ